MNQKYVCVQKNKAQDHFCNIIVPSMGGGETEQLVGELFAPTKAELAPVNNDAS